jgi:hypothetical protein
VSTTRSSHKTAATEEIRRFAPVPGTGRGIVGYTREKGDAVDGLTEERIARNNATFRDANEHISAAAGIYGIDSPVPFICECADPHCSEIVRMRLEEYEAIRAHSRHFLHIPGHQDGAGVSQVVARRDGYVIVQQVGRAGDIAEALDERRPEDRGEITKT